MDSLPPYLTTQLITYIGNKRKLLSLISEGFDSLGVNPHKSRFFDGFAGSGIVSRLARTRGFEVHASDWEPYSFLINQAYLSLSPEDLESLFLAHGGLTALLSSLNSLSDLPDEQDYIAHYYSADTTEPMQADYRRRRLFYTRENGKRIDRIRERIEELYPGNIEGPDAYAKALLIALLITEASRSTNTSGVFKAYHKGFGGLSGDALKRILSPITLPYPALFPSRRKAFVYREDTNALAGRLGCLDVAYLDPPYNQHQYGSNYHLLNTIALWDKPRYALDINQKGVLENKAGIRKDWNRTRSDYCYRDTASGAFKALLDSLDARHIMISYSTDGIIPFEELTDLASQKGRLSLFTQNYTQYRGGRQSNSRAQSNFEFLLLIDTRKKTRPRDIGSIEVHMRLVRLRLIFKKHYRKKALEEIFESSEGGYAFVSEGKSYLIETADSWELEIPLWLSELTRKELDCLKEKLESALLATMEEELRELFHRYEEGAPEALRLIKKHLLPSLRKIAHRKYADIFSAWADRAEALFKGNEEIPRRVTEGLEEVKALFQRRLSS